MAAVPPEFHQPLRRVSTRAHLLNWGMSLSVRPLAGLTIRLPGALHGIRHLFRLGGVVLERVPARVTVTPVQAPGVRGEWVFAEAAAGSRQVVLYLHGGGYFFGAASLHRQVTWRMSQALRRPVLAIDYRLAPRYSFEHWRDDAVQAYEHLLARGYAARDIVIAGDSAGGHLTLVLLQTLRDRGLPRPSCGICISPWTDLSGDSDSVRDNGRRDPMIASGVLRHISSRLALARSPYDPLVSPVHGDFRDLPPLYLLVGSTELLRDHTRRVARVAREAGVSVRCEEWHRMPHVFPIFAAVIPEGRRAFRHMADFVAALDAGGVAGAA